MRGILGGLLALLLASVAPQPGAATSLQVEQLLRDAYASESVTYMLDTRRALHAIPEASFQEHVTTKYVAKALAALGIPHTHPAVPSHGTGVIGVIGVCTI
jgi:metal-dependent amidase/aminoacylase/carboxypeptidase family protein